MILWSIRQNLDLMMQLGDKSAQGRACGNLGNTHYLLGNFTQAVSFHEEVYDIVLLHMFSIASSLTATKNCQRIR